MRRLLCFMLGALLLGMQALAQNKTVKGRVVDETGRPVAGASVVAKGSRTGVVTSESGDYTITIPSGTNTLVISAVGYLDQEVAVGNDGSANVTLRQDARSLEGVVVTGYTREKKSQFPGAATILSGKVVEAVPVGAFDQALQGRAPGVLVNSGSGQPGSSANVTIRGIASISGAGTQPLYVIDGVPMPAFDMQTINPNDFESITVLKDANSSALYGARGGTGVIVITTKKGRANQTTFGFRTQVGITSPPDFSRLNLMNSAEILQYEELMGTLGAPTNTPGWVYSKKNPTYATLTPAQQARYDFILDSIRQINMNWRDVLYRQGLSQTYELNMNGGTERTRFYISGQVFDQEGIDLGSSLTRYSTRINVEHTANKLTVALNSTAGYSNTNLSEGEWLGNSPRNPFQMTYRAKPYENPFKPDGSLNFGSSTSLNLKQVANLLEGIENSQWRQNQFKANAGLTLTYQLLSYLTLRNVTGIDFANDYFTRFVRPNSYIGSLQTYQSGLDIEANRWSSQLINTSSATFNKRFADRHDVEVGAYFEVLRARQRGFGFTLYNLDPRLNETGQGAGALPTNGAATMPQNATSAKSGFGIRSYFGIARYTYNEKYTLNLNLRRDGTSRIVNPASKEITTWSAGVIWNAIKENFMASQNILTDLRLRASYGLVPNIGSITTGTFNIMGIMGVTNYQGPQLPTFGSTSYAGSTIPGIAPSNPGLPDLKIEHIQKANLGIDFAMWDNRARFVVDIYNNKTIDLFVSQPHVPTSGFFGGSATVNAGTMSNKGVEFMVNVDVLRNRDWNIAVGINHSINKNKIEDLGRVSEYPVGTFIIKEGLPYGTHYTYHYLGADPATGRPRYEKADGTETTDIGQAGLFHKFGTYLPVHVGGFNTDIRFKGFSVSAHFSYQFDVSRYDNINNWITRGTPGYHAAVNASRELFTMQWQKPGDVALYQSPLYDRGFTSADVKDAKFLRFRNLIVAYQVPRIAIGNTTIIRSARVYVQGQNIAIWSPWQGLDPEDNNNISLNEYPNPKMFVAGIDINF